MPTTKRTPAEELRQIVRNLDSTNEGFNDRFTLEELIAIGRAFLACGWDIYPDQWTQGQVQAALAGIPPSWDADERATA